MIDHKRVKKRLTKKVTSGNMTEMEYCLVSLRPITCYNPSKYLRDVRFELMPQTKATQFATCYDMVVPFTDLNIEVGTLEEKKKQAKWFFVNEKGLEKYSCFRSIRYKFILADDYKNYKKDSDSKPNDILIPIIENCLFYKTMKTYLPNADDLIRININYTELYETDDPHLNDVWQSFSKSCEREFFDYEEKNENTEEIHIMEECIAHTLMSEINAF